MQMKQDKEKEKEKERPLHNHKEQGRTPEGAALLTTRAVKVRH